MKPLFALLLSLALLSSGRVAAEPSQAAMISDFRLKHGEGRVTMDATLVRIAHEQAKAMAAKETLDHDVLGSFNSRVAPAKAGRAAENIAYGYDSFEKTLGQWIELGGTPKESAAAQRLARRHRQRQKRLPSHLLGDGDRRRL